MRDETKDSIQQKAVDLSEQHKNLLLSWPTGCGKGLAVMKCILASKSTNKWLIVVPEIVQIANWWQDCSKWGLEAQISPLVEGVVCYASFKKWSGKALNLALNEAHRISEERALVIHTVKYDQLLLDTATLPNEVRDRLPIFYEYKISMKEAVEWKILPPPEIKIHYIELNDTNKIYERRLKNKKIILETAKIHYNTLTNNYLYWKKQVEINYEPWKEKRMFLCAINRKRFLANYKTEKAKEIIQLIQYQRFIVFCGSVKQAKELGGEQTVHSGNKNNQELIDEFNTLKTNSLYACSMMKEGMNLTNIESGLITQLDSKDLGNIQRLGRILRSEYPELHLICIKDTKDEEYLSNFMEAIND